MRGGKNTTNYLPKCHVTMFGESAGCITEGITYNITHVYIGKYKQDRILKTSDVSQITKSNAQLNIDIGQRDVELSIKDIHCNIVVVDMKSLATTVSCPKCATEVSIDDDIVICTNCSLMTTEDQCKSKCAIACTLMEKVSNKKHEVEVVESVLTKVVSCSINENIKFLKQLIKLDLVATVDLRENRIVNLELHSKKND